MRLASTSAKFEEALRAPPVAVALDGTAPKIARDVLGVLLGTIFATVAPGVHISAAELGRLLSCTDRHVRRGTAWLAAERWLVKVDQYRDLDWTDTRGRRWSRKQRPNVYILGPAARAWLAAETSRCPSNASSGSSDSDSLSHFFQSEYAPPPAEHDPSRTPRARALTSVSDESSEAATPPTKRVATPPTKRVAVSADDETLRLMGLARVQVAAEGFRDLAWFDEVNRRVETWERGDAEPPAPMFSFREPVPPDWADTPEKRAAWRRRTDERRRSELIEICQRLREEEEYRRLGARAPRRPGARAPRGVG